MIPEIMVKLPENWGVEFKKKEEYIEKNLLKKTLFSQKS